MDQLPTYSKIMTYTIICTNLIRSQRNLELSTDVIKCQRSKWEHTVKDSVGEERWR